MELLRETNCDRLVLLVRLGESAFAVQWRDGAYYWRQVERVRPARG